MALRVGLIVPVPAERNLTRAALLARHRYNQALAAALARAGARVRLYVDAPFTAEVPLAEGATLLATSRPRLLSLAQRSGMDKGGAWHLVRRALDEGAELLHQLHLLDARALPFLALARVPCFAEYNGGAAPGAVRRLLLRASSGRLRGAFFTARRGAAALLAGGALHRALPLHAVPEVSSLLPEPSLSARPVKRTVLVVGRIAAEKDPGTISQALRLLAGRQPDLGLRWVTPDDDASRALAARLAGDPVLGPRLQLGPAREEEMPAVYAQASVLLHPSRRETCSLALIEALQHAVPAATSDIAPLRALGGDCAGVRQVPPGDPPALARAAEELLADPEARTAARARYQAALSYDAAARRRLAIFSGVEVPLDY